MFFMKKERRTETFVNIITVHDVLQNDSRKCKPDADSRKLGLTLKVPGILF